MCLRLHPLTEATAARLLYIVELTTAVAAVALLLHQAYTAHLQKGVAAALLRLRAAATALLVELQPKHNPAWRIQVVAEVAARMLRLDIQEQRVATAS